MPDGIEPELLESPTALDQADEKLRNNLLGILNTIEKEEQPSRELLVRTWKYYDLLWNGVQPIFWNAADKEWQLINKVVKLPNNVIIDPSALTKSINIVRPYGESIAGAVTTGLPKVNYFPENADNVDDIKTAKAYSKIERIIAEHNEMENKLLGAAMTLWKFGMVAAYNYPHEDKKYGVTKKPVMGDVSYTNTDYTCPNCAETMKSTRGKTDFSTDIDISKDEILSCVSCNQSVIPIPSFREETVNEQVGIEEIPRSRQIVRFYSPLEVKIPIRARTADEVGWVIIEEELHYAQLRKLYPEYAEKINGGESAIASAYERWARSNFELDGETLENATTIQRVWLRPWAYYVLSKEDAVNLSKLYPEGAYFAVINNEIVEIKGEDMDTCWTFSENPGDRRIMAVPPIKNVVPIQETVNDVMSLEVKSLKHSIPTAFADPELFNFDAYRRTRKEPGLVYPMKLPPSGRLSDSITELRTAVFPKEGRDLDLKLEKLAQFTTGAFPSVFGGASQGSKTAFEYKESKNNALQRLSIIWRVISQLYANVTNKSVRSYIDNMTEEEETYAIKRGNSYINVWIKKSELTGVVGRVVPEISEQFPTSWAQKKQTITELLETNNEVITSIIFHPENVGLLAKVIGLDELYVPGDNDRNRQLSEITELIAQAPIIDEMGQQVASIPTDPMLDNSQVHVEVMRAFASSDAGQYVKDNNPEGWQNFMLHLQEHVNYMQQQQMEEMEQAAAENEPKPKPSQELPVQ